MVLRFNLEDGFAAFRRADMIVDQLAARVNRSMDIIIHSFGPDIRV